MKLARHSDGWVRISPLVPGVGASTAMFTMVGSAALRALRGA